MSEEQVLKRKILVLESEKLNLQDGFSPAKEKEVLNKISGAFYKERDLVEEDASLKQIIPYVAMFKDDKILTYERSRAGVESRLYNQWSLGVGGHIDEPDDLFQATLREIEEEIGVRIQKDNLKIHGF